MDASGKTDCPTATPPLTPCLHPLHRCCSRSAVTLISAAPPQWASKVIQAARASERGREAESKYFFVFLSFSHALPFPSPPPFLPLFTLPTADVLTRNERDKLIALLLEKGMHKGSAAALATRETLRGFNVNTRHFLDQHEGELVRIRPGVRVGEEVDGGVWYCPTTDEYGACGRARGAERERREHNKRRKKKTAESAPFSSSSFAVPPFSRFPLRACIASLCVRAPLCQACAVATAGGACGYPAARALRFVRIARQWRVLLRPCKRRRSSPGGYLERTVL